MIVSSCGFSFLVSLSFYGWSFPLGPFNIGYFVIDNTFYRVFDIFPFMFPWWSCYKLYDCLRVSCRITVPHASPSYILSSYIAKLNPIWIHYRNIPNLITLQNYTLSQSITKVSFHIELITTVAAGGISPAGVIISPRRKNYLSRGTGRKFKKRTFLESPTVPKVSPLCIFIHSITLELILGHYPKLFPISIHYRTIPYLITLPSYTLS